MISTIEEGGASKRMARLTKSSKILKEIIRAIQDKKGEHIITLDLRKIPEAVSDFFIVCEAGSSVQVRAIAEWVETNVKKECGELPYKHEGMAAAQWVLVDYINVVVHVFLSETRKFYRLEEMWSDAVSSEEKADPSIDMEAMTKMNRSSSNPATHRVSKSTAKSPSNAAGKKAATASAPSVVELFTQKSVKPAAKPASKPSAAKASKPAVKPASKPAAAKASKPAVKPAAKPVSKPSAAKASKPAAKPVSKPSAAKASKPAAKPASKPAAAKASKPAAKPASKPAAAKASKPASRSAGKSAKK